MGKHVTDHPADELVAMSQEEILSLNVCNCGTVGDMVNEAARIAFAPHPEGKCLIWEVGVLAVVAQFHANMIVRFNKAEGMERKAAIREAQENMEAMDKLARIITLTCKARLRDLMTAQEEERGEHLH